MACTHANKKVPLRYRAYIVIADSSAQPDSPCSNLFLASDLCTYEENVEDANWISEQQYRVPGSGKNALPISADSRSMSDVQEAAQLLGGKSVPHQVLKSLFKVMGVPITAAVIFNLTPLRWHAGGCGVAFCIPNGNVAHVVQLLCE